MLNSFKILIGKSVHLNIKSKILFTASAKLSSSQSCQSSRKLESKVAIVTGSTEGIGLAVAKRLAEDGAKVVVCSRKKDKVDKATDELKSQYPDQIIGTTCHVGAEEDRNHLIDFTLKHFGGIDILVSNVAVSPHFGGFMDVDEKQWDKIFEINVKAPYLLTKLVVPHMMKNNRPGDKGSIIYISSFAGYIGTPGIGAYSVSKTALLGLCKNASLELGPERIRVNAVAPGIIRTKFSDLLCQYEDEDEDSYYKLGTHLKRLGEPKEIGGIVSFLAGPDSSYITGENFVVAGGFHCCL